MVKAVTSSWSFTIAVFIAVSGWWCLQILPVSGLAIKPISIHVNDTEVAFHRSFPLDNLGFDRPRLSYVEVVKPLTPEYNDGHICEDRGGPFRYTRSGGDQVARWDIARWASDCLSDPAGFVWSGEWTWHIGNFPVGPVALSQIILLDGKCPYRVSTNDIIHGPNSPYHSATSTAHCFNSRDGALEWIERTAE